MITLEVMHPPYCCTFCNDDSSVLLLEEYCDRSICLVCLSNEFQRLNQVDPLTLLDDETTLDQAQRAKREAIQEVETFKRTICKVELETLEATNAELLRDNEKLSKENEILRELLDRPDASGAKFSYEEIKQALG